MAERRRGWLVVSRDVLVDVDRSPKFLRLRSVTTALEGPDGARTDEGTWDFVERPMGPDAVVVVVYRRTADGVEVLLRSGVRVPICLGRAGQPRGAGRHHAEFVEELVAGIVEEGEASPAGLRARARAEVLEEAGIELDVAKITPLGAPLWVAPGVCADLMHYFAADATTGRTVVAAGDGSPFEALGEVAWYALGDAIARVAQGSGGLGDLRTELGLRRLAEQLTS